MAEVIIDICDQVVSLINGLGLTDDIGPGAPSPVSATRSYLPDVDLEDLATTTVVVLPNGTQSNRVDRESFDDRQVIYVGVRRKLAPTDRDAQSDAMLALAGAIKRGVRSQRITVGGKTRRPTSVRPDPLFDADHLREHNVFVQLIRFEYPFDEGAS